ncbi:hypothetical protein KKF05_05380 [Patescibacteria group bacterium]|nr:hypothetical protein [Patescibacteria group bacterium]
MNNEKVVETTGLCLHGNFSSSCSVCAAEVASSIEQLRAHLVEYLELKTPEEAERIKFVRALDLPAELGDQYHFLSDERLANVLVAVIPDELWVKGAQPSESSAERGLINVRAGYFEGEAGNSERDPSAWLTHELAHCQRYLEHREDYAQDSDTPAFDDIDVEVYPNNRVEEHAFNTQFAYLKSKGIEREGIVGLLKTHYKDKDFEFFDRILDRVYKGSELQSRL